MIFRAQNPEIKEPFVRAFEFGPDFCVGWIQGFFFDRWPPRAGGVVKVFFKSFLNAHIWFLNPFNVRAETSAPRHVQGEVHTQPALFRQWVYQIFEWVPGAVTEVTSFRAMQFGYLIQPQTIALMSESNRAQAG
jgi:hypothetical protein